MVAGGQTQGIAKGATIRYDADVFPSIIEFYEDQRSSLNSTRTYIETNCQVGDSFGFLLSMLKPVYESARDRTSDAMAGMDGALAAMIEQVKGYVADEQINQEADVEQIEGLTQRVQELEERITEMESAPGVGPSGGFPGPGGGGGSAPGIPQPTAPEPPVDIQPDRDDDSTPDDDDTTPDDDDTTPDDDDTTPDDDDTTPDDDGTVPDVTVDIDIDIDGDGVVVIGDGNDLELSQLLDPQKLAEQINVDALRDADNYDKIWDELAATDPLGRTAEELRLAWEARDQIEVDPASIESLGYAEDIPAPPRFTFLDAETFAVVTSIGGAR